MKPTYNYLIFMILGMSTLLSCRHEDGSERRLEDSPQVIDLVPPPPPIDSFEEGVVWSVPDDEDGDSIPGFNEFVILDKEPMPLNLNAIKQEIGYPAEAREAEIDGKVILRILVDEKGKYMKHVVLKDPHPLLTKAVEKQIPDMRFSPGEKNGKAVKTWVTIPFQFTLLK